MLFPCSFIIVLFYTVFMSSLACHRATSSHVFGMSVFSLYIPACKLPPLFSSFIFHRWIRLHQRMCEYLRSRSLTVFLSFAVLFLFPLHQVEAVLSFPFSSSFPVFFFVLFCFLFNCVRQIETPILNLAKRVNHWTWDPNEERKRQERWQQEQERLLQVHRKVTGVSH